MLDKSEVIYPLSPFDFYSPSPHNKEKGQVGTGEILLVIEALL